MRLADGARRRQPARDGSLGDPRIPAAELRRAVPSIEALARAGDTVVIAGDFNAVAAHWVLERLLGARARGSTTSLVRGAEPSPIAVWPDERRLRDGMLLSDHPPIEVEL